MKKAGRKPWRICKPAAVPFPDNPLGPDVILPAAEIRNTWPHRQDVPMHFAHPRFGARLAADVGSTR